MNDKKWLVVITGIDVIPENDIKGHSLGMYCHCKPKIEIMEGILSNVSSSIASSYHMSANTPLIIHNSFDGREVVEQAEQIIKEMEKP